MMADADEYTKLFGGEVHRVLDVLYSCTPADLRSSSRSAQHPSSLSCFLAS